MKQPGLPAEPAWQASAWAQTVALGRAALPAVLPVAGVALEWAAGLALPAWCHQAGLPAAEVAVEGAALPVSAIFRGLLIGPSAALVATSLATKGSPLANSNPR